jgi:hypothetical protein
MISQKLGKFAIRPQTIAESLVSPHQMKILPQHTGISADWRILGSPGAQNS